jgi:hypothetical protein
MYFTRESLWTMLLILAALEIFPWIVLNHKNETEPPIKAVFPTILTLSFAVGITCLGFIIETIIIEGLSAGFKGVLELSFIAILRREIFTAIIIGLLATLAISITGNKNEKLIRATLIISMILVLRDLKMGALKGNWLFSIPSSFVVSYLAASIIRKFDHIFFDRYPKIAYRSSSELTNTQAENSRLCLRYAVVVAISLLLFISK